MANRSILFLSHFFGSNPGNFIPSLLALEDQITRSADFQNYHVVYAFPEECRDFCWCRQMLADGKTIHFYSPCSTGEALRFLEQLVQTENVALIHSHFEALGRGVYLFCLKHRKIPVIWHKHNDFTLGQTSSAAAFKRRVKDLIVDRLLTTVAVSPHLKTPGGHVLLNHLVSSRIPEADELARAELRRSLGLSPSDVMILMFGWDKTLKGVDTGCRMLSHLPQPLRSRCKLCVIMADTDENHSYIADHCTEPDQVILLKNTDDIFSYHRAADVMLSAARSEAFAYTIFEALAVATPVVSSDIPGVQWSRAYENVRFFRAGDPADCARALRESVENNDPNENARIAHRVREDYAIEKWCSQLMELYRSTGAFR